MLALLEQLGGSTMVDAFNREMLPLTRRSAKWDEPLTEEQYQHGLRQIQRELPDFQHALLTGQLPALPELLMTPAK